MTRLPPRVLRLTLRGKSLLRWFRATSRLSSLEHTVQTVDGPLTYEAQIGRLAIRRGDDGEVHGYIFFVAYRVEAQGESVPRPITFAWNGGPGVPSSIIHMGGLGPRLMVGRHIQDSPETLLRTTDLVFMDAMETGFSRPASEGFASEFFTLRGDVAATAEFIRAFRTRLRAMDQPVFIAGESYGVFRAAALSDFMVDRGDRLDGTILISGDFPNVPQPIAFYDAMHIPARTATAFYYKRLPPDLMKNRAATMKAVVDWATNVYEPALEDLGTLSEAQKTRIIAQLARYIGMKPADFSRKTLVMHASKFITNFMGSDGENPLSEEDTRELQAKENLKGSPAGARPLSSRRARLRHRPLVQLDRGRIPAGAGTEAHDGRRPVRLRPPDPIRRLGRDSERRRSDLDRTGQSPMDAERASA